MFALVFILTIWFACGTASAIFVGITHFRQTKRLLVSDLGLLGTVILAGPIVLVCLPFWWIEGHKDKVLIGKPKNGG